MTRLRLAPRFVAALIGVISLAQIAATGSSTAIKARGPRPAASSYVAVRIPDFEGAALNDYGQIAGVIQPTREPAVWTPDQRNGTTGELTLLSNVPSGGDSPINVVDINSRGQVVCWQSVGLGSRVLLWSPVTAQGNVGDWTVVVQYSALFAYAGGINDEGVIVGTRANEANRGEGFIWEPKVPNGTVGTERGLGGVPNQENAQCNAINNAREIAANGLTNLPTFETLYDPWVWRAPSGGPVDKQALPRLGGMEGQPGSINEGGTMAGQASPFGLNQPTFPAVWQKSGSGAYNISQLPIQGGMEAGRAVSINAADSIVGYIFDFDGASNAWANALWEKQSGGSYKINPAPADALRNVTEGFVAFGGINSADQILAGGSGGVTYLVSPPPPLPPLEVFDANIDYTSGVELPTSDTSTLSVLGTDEWSAAARRVKKAAADGVTLLLLRLKVDPTQTGPIRFRLEKGDTEGPLGSLWPVDNQTLVDRSDGGLRDTQQEGPTQITVSRGATDGARFAVVLYRAPRNFDNGLNTIDRYERTIHLRYGPSSANPAIDFLEPITLVRPLVILQHGTYSSPDTWGKNFHLYSRGMQQERGYRHPPDVQDPRPFYVARTSFVGPTGGDFGGGACWHVNMNVNMIRPQVISRIKQWREVIKAAATQADVITHSYGGTTMRYFSQLEAPLQPGEKRPNPLTISPKSFRRRQNWGHGYFHKLITIAATHRGAAGTNHVARLNRFGHTPGFFNWIARQAGMPTDQGAMEDQFVISPALQKLKETRLPCHAFVGSGKLDFPDSGGAYATKEDFVPFFSAYFIDKKEGPYWQAGNPLMAAVPHLDKRALQRQANYQFNLQYEVSSGEGWDPNYDLTVSSHSASALLKKPFISDINDLGVPDQAGRVSHLYQTNNPLVSARMEYLLHQTTTSGFFTHFKAFSPATNVEETKLSNLREYDPAWLKIRLGERPTSGLAARATRPTMTASDPDGEVCPGQEVNLSVAWSGKTIASVAYIWKSIGVNDGFVLPEKGRTDVDMTVPAQPPGAFGIVALISATDGATDAASVELEICDPDVYEEIRCEPPTLELRDTSPAWLMILGRNAAGDWRSIGASKYTKTTSANPNIARVLSTEQVEPANFGTTTLHITSRGGVSVDVPVTVDGTPIQVSGPKKLSARSKKAASFAFLSGTGFDASTIVPATIRINGLAPKAKRDGTVGKLKDVNRDRLPDLVISVKPADLHLAAGKAQIRMLAATTGGTLVGGTATVPVR